MKQLLPPLSLVLLLCLRWSAQAQQINRTFQTKTFTHTVNRTDTSKVIPFNDYNFIVLSTATNGTDSMIVKTYIDELVGNKWITTARDTIKFGPVTTTTANARVLTLRNATTDYLAGGTQWRVRNVLTGYATGDSLAGIVGSYDQYFVMRSTK